MLNFFGNTLRGAILRGQLLFLGQIFGDVLRITSHDSMEIHRITGLGAIHRVGAIGAVGQGLGGLNTHGWVGGRLQRVLEAF